VGEIYLQDSTGTDIRYNAIHWNGEQWKLKQINFYTICGQSSLTPYPAKSIFAFNDNDIWIAMDGDQIAHWDGNSQDEIICLPVSFSINKLWGENAHSLFAVGAAGNIIHYNGSNWQKQESGTDVDLTDIWGSPDGSVVWACGWDDFKPTVLLRKRNGGNWEVVYNDQDHLFQFRPDSLSGTLHSVWTNNNEQVYVLTRHNLYLSNEDTRGEGIAQWQGENWASRKVRGTTSNDIFTVGFQGRIWHFNGKSW
ncbi:MAG: glucosyl transferase, partial [Aliifodinibius sp.]|nr:glucosyl transferase [candidate division KSB1 bacterium]NIS44811.1 glucosyl transferase [candidate division Zixibacteria bacterium]NIT55458.1 glucosyl transferase [Fodinibius sp.]NIW43713.1 glucosyl transferase [Gammaproteobacteria bacterium]NIU12904.1 glucosyl transferase [candidate division Zixibacteria bacterium]